MSQKEIDRLAIIQQVQAKLLSQVGAAQQLNLSTRQVRRLQRQYEQLGAEAIISKRRGTPSNRRLGPDLKTKAIQLIKAQYHDFGPTFAHQKLTEQHQLAFSVETLRQWMIQEGIWQGKQRKPVRIHPMRTRRPQLGELIQIDGSPHDWFEGRAPECCLIVFVDDATSQLMALRFVEVESTQAYFDTMEAYVKQHGRPLGVYSDRHSIFRINTPEATRGTGETQFGRAMRELGIELICANSPQAKGRVERANGTLQDRLVKEMRLNNISDIHTANTFLPKFIEDYNQRFAVAPANATNANRSALPDEVELNLIFSQQHTRTVSNTLEVSYNHVIYQIQSKTPGYTMRHAKLTVCERKGKITLLYKGKSLPYKTFDKNNKPAEVVSSKGIEPHKKVQPRSHKPQANHPWRNSGINAKELYATRT